MKAPGQTSIGEVDPERKSLEVIETMTRRDVIGSTDMLMDIERKKRCGNNCTYLHMNNSQ
jgi:hypothetical protein